MRWGGGKFLGGIEGWPPWTKGGRGLRPKGYLTYLDRRQKEGESKASVKRFLPGGPEGGAGGIKEFSFDIS